MVHTALGLKDAWQRISHVRTVQLAIAICRILLLNMKCLSIEHTKHEWYNVKQSWLTMSVHQVQCNISYKESCSLLAFSAFYQNQASKAITVRCKMSPSHFVMFQCQRVVNMSWEILDSIHKPGFLMQCTSQRHFVTSSIIVHYRNLVCISTKYVCHT